jgi:DNA-binding transcriptional ArsR family regulator
MSVQRRELLDGDLRDAARYFHALRDVLRLRILTMLASSGEMTVTELARALHVSQPLVSFHLRPLRVLELVQVRRSGREVYCSVNLEEIRRRQTEFTEMLVESASAGYEAENSRGGI